MKGRRSTVAEMRAGAAPVVGPGARIGTVVGTDAHNNLLVDYPGNGLGPLPARLTRSSWEKLQLGHVVGREVLLIFEGDEPQAPVVIDIMHSPALRPLLDSQERRTETLGSEAVDVDRHRLVLDAELEVVLRCGEASIALSADGKVIIRGNYLVSRASGVNCIKGSSVRIN